MIILTAGSLSGLGQQVVSASRPRSNSYVKSLHIGPPAVGWSSTAFSSYHSHMLAGLAVNCCCLASRATRASVSCDSLISPPIEVVGMAPRVDLACQLTRSGGSSHLPISRGSHQRSLPYNPTDLTDAIWTAHSHSVIIRCILVSALNWFSAALACFIHRL